MIASMDTQAKLAILAESARYDASCATSGADRRGAGRGLGNALPGGICHSFADDGRCISLLKICLSNVCAFDCAYCVNRRSRDVPRATFTPQEIVDLTVAFYRRNYIEGLFLSSGVLKDPDSTMELLIRTVRKLREEERFLGYVHLKVIPGASPALVERAGRYADRLSVNIEMPSRESLGLLAPDKSGSVILATMARIETGIRETARPRLLPQGGPPEAAAPAGAITPFSGPPDRRRPSFAPAGQSTQMIVGAGPESDLRILKLSEGLYRSYRLRRVYYSALIPVTRDPRLPDLDAPPLRRENRLYQADWLLRFYGFHAGEIVEDAAPFLDLDVDPKTSWALRHRDFFPVAAEKADYGTLLRVPGLGQRSARRILEARRSGGLSLEALWNMGVVMKRARYFLTCRGKAEEPRELPGELIRRRLSGDDGHGDARFGQGLLFEGSLRT